MGEHPDQPAALVLFAGGDVWSSLQSLAWLKERQRLDGVFIFHTPDARRSTEPAERLRRFCSKRWPDLRLVLPAEPLPATSAKVIERLRDWRRFRADVKRWVVDATNAPRAALGGLAEVLAADASWEAVYRDTEGVWQVLRPAGGGRVDAAPLTPAPPANVTDSLPVAELIATFATDVAEVRVRESREPEALPAEELGRIVLNGSRCNWDWGRMYTEALGRAPRLEGFAFEDFVGAALALMGVRNVRIGLKVTGTDARAGETVLDVAVNRRGRIYVFDCRARDEQRDPGPAVPAITLEGLWPTCVAVRPNRWATDAERAMAAFAGNVRMIDADGCRQFFTWLGRLMDVDTPAALRDLERQALRLGASRLPVFTPATSAQRLGEAVHVDNQVFDLVKGGRVEAGGNATAWRAARVSPELWFIEGRAVSGGVGPELQRRLAVRLSEQKLAATILFFELTVNKKYWHALVRVAGDSAPFAHWLHKWRNMPLVV